MTLVAYSTISDEDYAAEWGAERVNAWLRRLNRIDNNDWRPAALWALKNHPNDPEYLDEFLRRLERIAANMLVRRVYAAPRAQRYAELLQQLDDREGLDAAAFELTHADQTAMLDALAGDIYLTAPVRKYVLLRLDESLAGDEPVTYTHRLITVEHVLPQTPAPGSEWMTNFDDEQRQHWIHKLANLVLLSRSRNSQAQNLDFAEKKDRYFTSKKGVASFALTTQILAESEWTPESLERRQASLLKRLSREWGIRSEASHAD